MNTENKVKKNNGHYTLRNIKLKPTDFGFDIIIKAICKYDENGEWVENIKLDRDAIKLLKNHEIPIEKPKRKRI